MSLFMKADKLPKAERSIDVHARFSVGKEHNWYSAMRSAALNAVQAMPNLNFAVGTGIRWSTFMHELRHSKICLSPFGYGEICWRDIEAMLTGSVVLKQDMSHLVTKPNLYQISRDLFTAVMGILLILKTLSIKFSKMKING